MGSEVEQHCENGISSCSNDPLHHQFSSRRLSDMHLASRKAEEAASRRYIAASWLQKMAGPMDLCDEPSEEDLRLCLRNGLVLCNLINKLQPGSVQKVVENPTLSSVPADGPALSAYQYFENVRNFLVAVENMKLPSFEASDLEKGSMVNGSMGKVVDCILALKSYHEWRQNGGNGLWKFGCLKSPSGALLRNSSRSALLGFSSSSGSACNGRQADPLTNLPMNLDNARPMPNMGSVKNLSGEFAKVPLPTVPLHNLYHPMEAEDSENAWPNLEFASSWICKITQMFPDMLPTSVGLSSGTPNRGESNYTSHSMQNLIKTLLRGKELEEISVLVEFMLRRVMEEYEQRLLNQLDPPQRDNSEANLYSQEQAQRELELRQIKSSERENQLRLESQKREFEVLKEELRRTKSEVLSMQRDWEEKLQNLDKHIKSLAHVAEGYHKVAAENRELYNEVQDLKGNIRVYCRVRPSFLPDQTGNQSTVESIGERGTITITNPAKQGKDSRKSFRFNKVFGPSALQEEVYLDMQPLIRSVLDGYNVCILAYGQTGSGKTHTMCGPDNATPQDWGVNFRALNDLFDICRRRSDLMKYEVGVQMLEIYNEQVRDLLCADSLTKKLEIRNNSQQKQKGLNVADANMVSVKSNMDVLDVMRFGQKNRAVGATAMNERSSRSHSVLTVHVEGTDLTCGAVFRGCLHLVDLAGSERVDKSEAVGDRLKEAQHINRSLSALGDVISALAQKSPHIPYRNSKLTQLLQDSLGGQAKTLMFVHMSPDESSYGETLSTLKFAERAATVELGAAHSNKESAEIRELKEQITALKEAVVKKDAEVGRAMKDNRVKSSDNGIDKGRAKLLGISPRASTTVEIATATNVYNKNCRQPLEEMRNAEIRQNHMALAQKLIPSSDPLSVYDEVQQESRLRPPSKRATPDNHQTPSKRPERSSDLISKTRQNEEERSHKLQQDSIIVADAVMLDDRRECRELSTEEETLEYVTMSRNNDNDSDNDDGYDNDGMYLTPDMHTPRSVPVSSMENDEETAACVSLKMRLNMKRNRSSQIKMSHLASMSDGWGGGALERSRCCFSTEESCERRDGVNEEVEEEETSELLESQVCTEEVTRDFLSSTPEQQAKSKKKTLMSSVDLHQSSDRCEQKVSVGGSSHPSRPKRPSVVVEGALKRPVGRDTKQLTISLSEGGAGVELYPKMTMLPRPPHNQYTTGTTTTTSSTINSISGGGSIQSSIPSSSKASKRWV